MNSKNKSFEIREIDPALKTFVENKIAELKDTPQFGIDFGYRPSIGVESYQIPNIDRAIVWAHRAVALPELLRKLKR